MSTESRERQDPNGYRDFPMPEPLAASARAWLDRSVEQRGEPVPARRSATVMLVRPGDPDALHAGLEVFVLRRASSMAFAPGNLAFPGGGVDHRDAATDIPWAGPEPQLWAQMLGRDADSAKELVVAAAREVFEEAGVLLAGRPDGSVVADPAEALGGADPEEVRRALIAREIGFGQLLADHGLLLRSDLMRPRGWWTTPECEPRRFDTVFFLAALPRGQAADGRSTEAAHTAWVSPQAALAQHAAGHEVMLPPTIVMLEQLLQVSGVGPALAQRLPVRQVMPWPVEHTDRLWMRAPIDAAGHGVTTSR